MSVIERYAGKVAVVTGASAGIGKAIAVDLVKSGLKVAALARRYERLETLAKDLSGEKGSLHPFKCDVTNEQDILNVFREIASQLGPVQILINNAGVSCDATIIEGDTKKWRTVLDTNVMAVAIGTREAIQSMKEHNLSGHIVNINSTAGHQVRKKPGVCTLYAPSKHALTALTETIRLEINRNKLPIKITSVSPGFVKTEMFEATLGKERGLEMSRNVPGLKSEDIADAVHYVLATPDHVNIKELTLCIRGQET